MTLRFDGRVEIAATREAVWNFVSDPTRVGRCGPGVETVEATGTDTFRSVARIGIGAFRARFTVDAKFLERVPGERAVVAAHGNAPGSAVDATATMELSDGEPGHSVMEWQADVDVGGRVASIGARLLQGTANKMIAQTFDCIRATLEAGQGEEQI
jgi:carbon monoxide dehydrogenase subunit G